MTNRPRRSRPSKSRGQTIDLEANDTTGKQEEGTTAKPGDDPTAPPSSTPRSRAPAKTGAVAKGAAGKGSSGSEEPAVNQTAKASDTLEEFAAEEGLTPKAGEDAGSASAPNGGGAASRSQPSAAQDAEARSAAAGSMTGAPDVSPAGYASSFGRAGAFPEGPPSRGPRDPAADVQPGIRGGGFAIPGTTGGGTAEAAAPLSHDLQSAKRSQDVHDPERGTQTTKSDERPGLGEPPRSSGIGSAFAAGLIGAILALGGVTILQAYGFLPSFAPANQEGQNVSRQELAALVSEVEAIQQQVASSASVPAADEEIASGLAGVRNRLDALESRASQAADEAISGETLQASAEDAARLATGAQQAADTAQQAASEARQVASTAQETADAAQNAATNAQASADQAAQAATQAGQAAESANQAIAEVNTRLASIEERFGAIEAASQRATAALAAANLKSAIDSGEPFMGQLENFASAPAPDGASGDAVERLRQYAPEGVPTIQELAAQWPEVEDRIAAELAPQQSDAPVGDQILSGLRSLVQVRPSGPVPEGAEGPGAVLGRLDAALQAGNLEEWRSLWQSLPQPAQAVSEDFAGAVDARLTADEVVQNALSNAIGGGTTGETSSGSRQGANQG